MKKIIAIGIMLASINAFSQSYLVLNNGVTLTIDTNGYIYDFGHFKAPYKITHNGGQFLVEDEKLSTIDSNGLLYEKNQKIKKIKGKGLNYLVTDKNDLLTIDSNGFFYTYEKEAKVFKKIKDFGGNFFTVKPGDKKPLVELYTINSSGSYFKIDVEGLNPADITKVGGTFFQTKDGVVYTISKDGFVFSKSDVQVGAIQKVGGNYFLDSNNQLFTISEEGLLILPVLPMNINVNDLQNLGANYMIDSEGRIFTVDLLGNMEERIVGHDLRNIKIPSF